MNFLYFGKDGSFIDTWHGFELVYAENSTQFTINGTRSCITLPGHQTIKVTNSSID